ncbi:uncharacterized protein [Nicotiana tomentosiformis]|uniref:uncharacterized protein n=1 Tax=Nicotiana tomentosiformis TaxID=4098 RepID=UPI00388CB9D7
MTQRMKILEQQLKNMQGSAGQNSITFKDLCMFPDVRLPLGFKTPKFEKYDGHGDPIAYLKRYCNQLRGVEGKEELVMAYYGESLTGVAFEWFMDQETSHWHVWEDMAHALVKQFQYNIDITPYRNSLSNLKKKPTESFREYAIKWREQAARVKPPMDDHELITGKSFSEAIKIGEMVENGLKIGKIISQAVLKAANQAVQIESDNFSDINGKDEETMMTIRSRRGLRRTTRRYEQPHQVFDDSPEHYYPPQNLQYSIAPLQYVVQPPRHPRRRAPASQNLHQPSQIFQVPYNPHPSQGYRGEQRLKDNFTPIGDSYASVFEKLKHYDMIARIPPNHGHNVESCRDLKREIERMIQEKLIVIQDNDTQNITRNPLHAHDNAHFVGMMCGDMEYENPHRNLPTEIGEGHGDSDEKICG